jgi:hypothetical protein
VRRRIRRSGRARLRSVGRFGPRCDAISGDSVVRNDSDVDRLEGSPWLRPRKNQRQSDPGVQRKGDQDAQRPKAISGFAVAEAFGAGTDVVRFERKRSGSGQ